MNKENLEKIAYDLPNDMQFGSKVRKTITESENRNEENIEPNWEDMFLRLSAEFDNYRKRVTRERTEIITNTKLVMIDTLLDIDTELSIAAKYSSDGVKLIMSKLDTFLSTQGIQSIQTETYEEDIHEVINIVNLEKKGIVDVVSKGYKIGDKIIRYPKVILSK